MTLCPVALVAGCKSCPIVSVCPAKSIIGDYKKEAESEKKGSEVRSSEKRSSEKKGAEKKKKSR